MLLLMHVWAVVTFSASAVAAAFSGQHHFAQAPAVQAQQVADAVLKLPRSSLEELLRHSAAAHPGVAERVLALAAAPVATAISHPRVALDGDDSSSALGRLVTIRGEGFVAGPGARSELVGCCQLRYFQAKQFNIAICYVQLHVAEFVP